MESTTRSRRRQIVLWFMAAFQLIGRIGWKWFLPTLEHRPYCLSICETAWHHAGHLPMALVASCRGDGIAVAASLAYLCQNSFPPSLSRRAMIVKTILTILSLYLLLLGFSEHGNAGGIDRLPVTRHRDLTLLAELPKYETNGPFFCYSSNVTKHWHKMPLDSRYCLKVDWQTGREAAEVELREVDLKMILASIEARQELKPGSLRTMKHPPVRIVEIR